MATYDQVKSALAALPHKEMVLATCEIVREQAWHLMTDERSKRAIEAAEGFVNGTVTRERLNSAHSAHSAASAAYAADYAASAAYAAALTTSAAYAAALTTSAAYAAAYAASVVASDNLSKLRDRQLEIIAKYAKKKDDGLVGLLTKDLEIAKNITK